MRSDILRKELSKVQKDIGIVGEKVLGQSLVTHFESAISLLEQMNVVEDWWIRRRTGVVVRFFAKRRSEDFEGN